MELYGPKKRGPKPKTFLLKVRRREPGMCVLMLLGWGVERAACCSREHEKAAC